MYCKSVSFLNAIATLQIIGQDFILSWEILYKRGPMFTELLVLDSRSQTSTEK